MKRLLVSLLLLCGAPAFAEKTLNLDVFSVDSARPNVEGKIRLSLAQVAALQLATASASDDECLTYDAGTNGFDWQACGGGGLADGDYGDVAVSGSGTVLTVESGTANALAPAVVIEGATADAFEGNFTFADPPADWTWAWDADGNVTGGTLFRLGGATSSFPMLKRSNGNLFFRLADDSGYTLLRSSGLDVYSDETSRVFAVYGPSPFTVVGMASGVPFGWASSPTDGGTIDTTLTRKSAATVNLASAFGSTLLASPPLACDAAAEGEFYSDTSHAACWCDGTTWTKLGGAGSCA